MKKTFLLLTALLFSTINTWAAENQEHREITAELMEVMQVETQIKAGFDAMLPMINQIAQQMKLDQAGTEELIQIYRNWFDEDLDQKKLTDTMIELYMETYTKQEIKGLIEFYQTPLGQKTLEVMPMLTQKGAEAGMQEAQSKRGQLMARLKPFMDKHKAEQEPQAEASGETE